MHRMSVEISRCTLQLFHTEHWTFIHVLYTDDFMFQTENTNNAIWNPTFYFRRCNTEVYLYWLKQNNYKLHIRLKMVYMYTCTSYYKSLFEFHDIHLYWTKKERYIKFSLKLRIFHLKIVKERIVIYNHQCFMVVREKVETSSINAYAYFCG